MTDKYKDFLDLAKNETQDVDFHIRLLQRKNTTLVIAPHGGGIEPGTSEIAEAIAGDDLSFYAFEGTKASGNRDLHITSTRFDEPRCMALARASPGIVAIHGEESDGQVAFLGGRDAELLKSLRDSLIASGFVAETHRSLALQGTNEANICNRSQSGCGVQLELSKGLRDSFFESLSRRGRQSKTQRFEQFVAAVRAAIL